MDKQNAAIHVRTCGATAWGRLRTWSIAIGALIAAFFLSVALMGVMPTGAAYADDEVVAPNADDGTVGEGTDTGNAGEGGSGADDDTSLTPTDSNGLKTDEPTDAGDSEASDVITVSILNRSGQTMTSFSIEKGKTITFIDEHENVLDQFEANEPTIVAPDAPTKSGYDFAGWSVKINELGNAVVTPVYNQQQQPDPQQSNDNIKASRSSTGVLTTSNSPKTGDMLTIAIPLVIAGVALVAILILLFTRRRK